MPSQYQQRYWNLLYELKVHVIYLQDYAASSEHKDRIINIFLAITSSSSIAAWAMWQEYQIVWACLIAASQVVTAIKIYLPYNKRIKPLSELGDQLQALSLECEKSWFSVSEGELTEKEIHNLTMQFRDASHKAVKKAFKNIIVPKKSSILTKAEVEAEQYISNAYSTGESI